MAVLAEPPRVQQATALEWPQIDALRRSFYELHGMGWQPRPAETRWFVARRGERVLGCYSVQDFPVFGQRWAHDFYVTPDRDGTRAVGTMYRHLYEEAALDELAVLFHCLPWDDVWIRALRRRGLKPLGVLMGGAPAARGRISPTEDR